MIARMRHVAVPLEKAMRYLALSGRPRFRTTGSARAKYYDFDASFLLELEPAVQHFEAYDS